MRDREEGKDVNDLAQYLDEMDSVKASAEAREHGLQSKEDRRVLADTLLLEANDDAAVVLKVLIEMYLDKQLRDIRTASEDLSGIIVDGTNESELIVEHLRKELETAAEVIQADRETLLLIRKVIDRVEARGGRLVTFTKEVEDAADSLRQALQQVITNE